MSEKRFKPSGLTAADVTVNSKETVFDGYFQIDRYHLTHQRFEGGEPLSVVREIFERGHAVAVVLFDPVEDCFVLVEQFRIGAFTPLDHPHFAHIETPWMLEIVAGIIDEGETPEAVAKRECREETGLEVSDLFPLCQYFATPGGSSEAVFLFGGRVDATKAGGHHGLEHEGEDIRVHVVGRQEVYGLMDQGRITNAMTLIGLQWFRLHADRVAAHFGQ
ncbi:MAG: NUDIX domain-containing protein [Magnetovibrionaceae bacterium]